MPADQVVVLPDDVSDESAAAVLLKGMTAELLLHRVERVRPGQAVLVHAAAGGVGLLLCQWAKALGAKVIGTVSSEDKARLARTHGCEFPIVTRDYRFAREVKNLTHGRGAEVIYDGLGREAAAENLEALAVAGHWVCFGQASGPLEELPDLGSKSGTLSRPVLFHYTAERAVLQEIAGNVFKALRNQTIRVELRHRYPLAAAAEAHRELEAPAHDGIDRAVALISRASLQRKNTAPSAWYSPAAGRCGTLSPARGSCAPSCGVQAAVRSPSHRMDQTVANTTNGSDRR